MDKLIRCFNRKFNVIFLLGYFIINSMILFLTYYINFYLREYDCNHIITEIFLFSITSQLNKERISWNMHLVPHRSEMRPILSLSTSRNTPVTVFTISRRYLILLLEWSPGGDAVGWCRKVGNGVGVTARCGRDVGVGSTLKYRRYARGARLQETSAKDFPGTVSHN